MNEYQLKLRFRTPGFFSRTTESIEIVKADSATEAVEIFNEKYASERVLMSMYGCDFSILEVKKI